MNVHIPLLELQTVWYFLLLPDEGQRLFLNFFNELWFLEYMMNSKDASMSK